MVDVHAVEIAFFAVIFIKVGDDNGDCTVFDAVDERFVEVEGYHDQPVRKFLPHRIHRLYFFFKRMVGGEQDGPVIQPFAGIADPFDHPEIKGVVDIGNGQEDFVGDIAAQRFCRLRGHVIHLFGGFLNQLAGLLAAIAASREGSGHRGGR